MRRPGGAIACLAASVLICSCESDGGGGAGGSDGSLGGYLGALPVLADDGPVIVTYGDLARAEKIAGLARPDDVGDENAIGDFVFDLTGTRRIEGEAEPAVAALLPSVAQPGQITDLEGFVDDLGWSLLDVDRYAEHNTPIGEVSALDGDFDRDALEDALDDAGDGVWVAGNPDGGHDIDNRTPARPLGQALWHLLDGNRLVVTSDEADLAATRDADGGEGTLADDARFTALAAALDGRDVYSAMLIVDDILPRDVADVILEGGSPDEDRERLETLPQCEGVNGVAVGVAHDGEPLIVIALSFVSDAAAEQGVDVVGDVLREGDDLLSQRPWSELFTVESVERDGSVVVATARPADMILGQWQDLIPSRALPPC